MNDSKGLEQKAQQVNQVPQHPSNKKMSMGTKALIGMGALTLGVYTISKKMWKLVYPPTFKKYLAIATIGLMTYSATHCNSVTVGAARIYNEKVRPVISLTVHQQKKIRSLEERLKHSKKELEEKEKHILDLSKELNELKELRKKPAEKNELRISRSLGNKSVSRGASLLEIRAGLGEERSVTTNPNNNSVRRYATRLSSQNSHHDVPFSVLEVYSRGGYENIIYVNKLENTLSLFEVSNKGVRKVKTYPCSTGINPAPKTRKGDHATPEGIYAPTYRNFSPNLPDLYGAGVIGINYPNSYDKKLGRTGQGIVLCGADYPDRIRAVNKGVPYTNGGIVMRNYDLRELDARISQQWYNTVFVIENPRRPVAKQLFEVKGR
ncbi:MAG TPA: hypothetical protein ENL16_02080 [Candidatus Woesearchaeota archaeon]|nr:hypothetical protein [Candidatus Woesearchaeota archaeon]